MKIAAAELLHGVITLAVGRAAGGPKNRNSQDSRYASLYSHLFPAALSLSISDDIVCKKLFHTLLFQLIRWFSGANNAHESERGAMMDSLLNGLIDPYDTNLRNQVYFQFSN